MFIGYRAFFSGSGLGLRLGLFFRETRARAFFRKTRARVSGFCVRLKKVIYNSGKMIFLDPSFGLFFRVRASGSGSGFFSGDSGSGPTFWARAFFRETRARARA